jgi:hypothetical protein
MIIADIEATNHQATWEQQRKNGAMNPRKYRSRGGNGAIKCKNGVVELVPGDPLNTFRCNNVRPQPSHLPPRHLL